MDRQTRSGLMKGYTPFKEKCDKTQQEAMDKLKRELFSLGRNPLTKLDRRFELGKAITELKFVVGSTVTLEGEAFMNDANWLLLREVK